MKADTWDSRTIILFWIFMIVIGQMIGILAGTTIG